MAIFYKKLNFNLLPTCNSVLEIPNYMRNEVLYRFPKFSVNYRKASILKLKNFEANSRNLMVAAPDLKNHYTISLTKPSSGKTFTIKGKEGDSLLDIIKDNDVDIPGFGACDGTIACSTCHLIFKEEDFNKLDSPITDDEIDMLTLAKDYCDTSRLGCQVCMSKNLDGVEIIVPEFVTDARNA